MPSSMDEEASFANLLSQSAAPARPSWEAARATDDPWANPFSDTSSTNPFAAPFPSAPTYPQTPSEEVSPYVQKLGEDVDAGVGVLPDPPSIIAAREQEESGFASPYQTPIQPKPDPFSSPPTRDPALAPFRQPESEPPTPAPPAQPSRMLPSELLDEDILGASDPSVSLKKAFVKSTQAQRMGSTGADVGKSKAYVFKPDRPNANTSASKVKEEGQGGVRREVEEKEKVEKVHPEVVEQEHPPVEIVVQREEAAVDGDGESVLETQPATMDQPQSVDPAPTPVGEKSVEATEPAEAAKPSHLAPASIPLPDSVAVTPTTSGPATPALPAPVAMPATPASPPSAMPFASRTIDRVAVPPLDAPAPTEDYGFKSLSIGAASSSLPPPPPSKSPVQQNGNGNGLPSAQIPANPLSSKLSGRGWGVVDDEEVGGLFGKGGPSVRPDPWGANHAGGWGETGLPPMPSSGPSQMVSPMGQDHTNVEPPASESTSTAQSEADDDDTPLALTNGSSSKPKPTTPLFQLSIGDPTRVGDPVRGYTVYTIRTRTTSLHYRRTEFSVLRRFSDFLWLFDALTANNPGVVVPPVPDKHPFGRFRDQFIETRRLALQRCLTRVTSHPVLQLDPDLRLFLESDAFAIEAKNRRAETPPDKQGLLAGWTGPKYVEQDDWFDSRKVFLDNLESQLKSLSKSIETASKNRLDMATGMGDFADSMTALAESDLGSAMCAALARLADLALREKESNEEQAKSDVIHLLNMADEYVRFIGSVRLAFASRIKAYQNWQNLEKEVVRLRSVREKSRQAGKLGDRTSSSLTEIGEVSIKLLFAKKN